jgi:hypothetical protein
MGYPVLSRKFSSLTDVLQCILLIVELNTDIMKKPAIIPVGSLLSGTTRRLVTDSAGLLLADNGCHYKTCSWYFNVVTCIIILIHSGYKSIDFNFFHNPLVSHFHCT